MTETRDVFKIRLRDYDHVGEVAHFNFVGSAGTLENFSINKYTFGKLVTKGAWNAARLGSISDKQKQFVEILKSEVKGDLVKWFEEITNEFMKQRTQSGNN